MEPAAIGSITATETDPNSANNTAAQSTTINNAHGGTITGTPGNNTLNSTNGVDVICGLNGADTSMAATATTFSTVMPLS